MPGIFKWLINFVSINYREISNSTIVTNIWVTRPKFKPDQQWIEYALRRHYGEEMDAKFIPALHQSNEFERQYLQDVLKFKEWVEKGQKCLDACYQSLERFSKEYDAFYQLFKTNRQSILDKDHLVVISTNELRAANGIIQKQLKKIWKILAFQGYPILTLVPQLAEIDHPIKGSLGSRWNLTELFKQIPDGDHFRLTDLVVAYNSVHSALNTLNLWLRNFKAQRNYKIITGIAGAGKTHTTVYLIKKIRENGDHVLFINAKSFNGDGVKLEERLHELWEIPYGLRLGETLRQLNNFAKKQGKRLFLLFDALNETTTTNLGFSQIWRRELQLLINNIKQFSHLYFICTLRTSYIESIWDERPAEIAELSSVDWGDDLMEMSAKYFEYYRINIVNPDTADYSYFKVPLLLDLYCKMVNEPRAEEVYLSLDIQSYLRIFEQYIYRLIQEVKVKRNLMVSTTITDGLDKSSQRFLGNISGTLPVADFVHCFDHPGVQIDHSIAHAILEGSLVFIRDQITPNEEIVKHTQQQIGGYLLACRLNDQYPTLAELTASEEFTVKINGLDATRHHQLRLDIVKFLVALQPGIIDSLSEKQAFQEGWWYLYNGDDGKSTVPDTLLANPLSLHILTYILQTSSTRWFDEAHPHNFKFIIKLLVRYDLWAFDLNWTFFLYRNVEWIFETIENGLERLQNEEIDEEQEILVAYFSAMVCATTVRELRDLATLYLIEFGKLFPLRLLEIVEHSASLNDSYIYERTVHALYGVVLIHQHNHEFIHTQLAQIAVTVFDLQFSPTATQPKFNYIVIDSIKHILDLAMQLEVWHSSEENLQNIKNYSVPNLPPWVPPTKAQMQEVTQRDDRNPPEPIGMDFAIYTIPRLLDSDRYELRSPAVANILARVYELGFKVASQLPNDDERIKSFYYGHNISRSGKVDKLGKKYNWKAYFDYAGYLLQQGQLNIYKTFGDPQGGYSRLGDVDIDISCPNPNHYLTERIYRENLIPENGLSKDWMMETKLPSIEQYLLQNFDGVLYVMLKGVASQTINEGYETRSFIMVESCMIEKNEGFQELKNEVCTKVFNWDRDLHLTPAYDTGSYFGEYYFTDNQQPESSENYSVKTGNQAIRKRKVKLRDILEGGFKPEDQHQEREFIDDKYLHFDGEATLIQYLNESDSRTFKGFGMYIPTVKMGKHLGLKADPATGQIIDANLNKCLITVEYEEGYFKNEFTYIRVDLLRTYLNDHGLALMFQNKQHSYNSEKHNRTMKYVVLDQF